MDRSVGPGIPDFLEAVGRPVVTDVMIAELPVPCFEDRVLLDCSSITFTRPDGDTDPSILDQ